MRAVTSISKRSKRWRISLNLALLSLLLIVSPALSQDHHHHQSPPVDYPSVRSLSSSDCICRQHQQPVVYTATKDNQYHRSQPVTVTTTAAAATPDATTRIFYLILVHNVQTLMDAIPLFRALRDARNSVVFHVDQKVMWAIGNATSFGADTTATADTGSNSSSTANKKQQEEAHQLKIALQTLQQEIESCPCGSRVHLDSVHNVEWSLWSMNLPTLWGMDVAIHHPLFRDKWDTFINLSGDSMVVYTPNTMANILSRLSSYNFVTSRSCETGLLPTPVDAFPSHWHKRAHYTSRDRDPLPLIEYTDASGVRHAVNVTIHFGSQWGILQRDFVRYIVTELRRPNSFACQYRDWLLKKRKVMTDETFLPTVLMYSFPFNATTLPKFHGPDEEDGALNDVLMYKNQDGSSDQNLPMIRTLRYERMDEHYPSPLRNYYPTHPRYEVPRNMTTPKYQKEHDLQLPNDPHIWGPYYLGVYDLMDIRESGALFLRKVCSKVDANIFNLLPVDAPQQIPPIQWPAGGVQASVVPDWESDKIELMRKAYLRAKAKGVKIPRHIQEQMEGKIVESSDTKDEESTIPSAPATTTKQVGAEGDITSN